MAGDHRLVRYTKSARLGTLSAALAAAMLMTACGPVSFTGRAQAGGTTRSPSAEQPRPGASSSGGPSRPADRGTSTGPSALPTSPSASDSSAITDTPDPSPTAGTGVTPSTAGPTVTNPPEVPPADSDVLARAPIDASSGGSVSADGVTLTVPPNVLRDDGTATISRDESGAFDLAVDQPWSGEVEVTVSLVNDSDLVLHRVDDDWIAESDAFGNGTVSVSHLSPFTSLSQLAKGAVCLKDSNPRAILACLAQKGVTILSKQLAGSIAKRISDSCYAYIASQAVPAAIGSKFGIVSAVAVAMFNGPCVAKAGEGNWSQPPAASPPRPNPPVEPPQPPPAAGGQGQVSLSQGAAAPYGSWYAVALAGFSAGSTVTLTCRDSVDPQGLYMQSVTVSGAGAASLPRLCYSADGPDHWVTTNTGVSSNHVSWGGGGGNPPPPATTRGETTGSDAHTWTNYTNAGGTQGQMIPAHTTVNIACRVQGFRVQDGNTWWYRIASAPWNNTYYVSADPFYNNGATSGDLHGTPFVDEAVPVC